MKLYKQRLLSDIQLKRLGEHKYSCNSNSILDPLLQPWWNWLVTKIPFWLAPNLITVIGLIVNILTTLILVWFSPDARGTPPSWALLLCGLGLFVYQSLDAIDGKQARRTGTANPLGELFDHGCDSVSSVFVSLSACIAVQLGFYPEWMFFQCFCAMTLFYCAHWTTYVSGTLYFGRIDVTEAQFLIIAIHFISAIFGPEIWQTEFFNGTIKFWYGITFLSIVGAIGALYQTLCAILSGGIGKNGSTVAIPWLRIEVKLLSIYFACLFAIKLALANLKVIFSGGAGKNGSTVAGTSVLSPIIPFSTVLLPAYIIYRKSTDAVYENNPSLYILAFGFVAAKITNRLVVAHMTKSEMDYLDLSLLGPSMLFLNQYFNTFIPEYYVLWLCMIYVTVDFVKYSGQICHEICHYLNIKLFKINVGGPRNISPPQSVSVSAEKNGTNPSRTIKTRSRSKYH